MPRRRKLRSRIRVVEDKLEGKRYIFRRVGGILRPQIPNVRTGITEITPGHYGILKCPLCKKAMFEGERAHHTGKGQCSATPS